MTKATLAKSKSLSKSKSDSELQVLSKIATRLNQVDERLGSNGKGKTNRNSVLPNGERLRELRAQLGLTQLELSFRLDLSERLVRKAEKGKRIDCRSLATFKQFFELQGLEVEMDELVQSQMSNQEIAKLWFQSCWIERDLDSINLWCDPEILFSVEGQPAIGRDRLENVLKTYFASFEGRYSIAHTFADRDLVILLWTCQVNGPIRQGTACFRIVNQRIVEFQDNWVS